MKILEYDDRYRDRAISFVSKFYHEEGLAKLGKFDPVQAYLTLAPYKYLVWLLEVKGKVVGIFGGMPRKSPIGPEGVFQEIIWYVLPEFRKYSIRFFKRVCEKIKDKDFQIMVTGCIENKNLDRMKKLYNKLGFKLLELQYIKKL